MNIILNDDDFLFKNIIFNDPIKNTVMNDSYFIRVNYSNKSFILNGIYIKIILKKSTNLYKILENSNNIKTTKFIEELEKYILTSYNNEKNHTYKIKDQLHYIVCKSNSLSSFDHNKDTLSYILKISGIWETNLQIGITYKFININHL